MLKLIFITASCSIKAAVSTTCSTWDARVAHTREITGYKMRPVCIWPCFLLQIADWTRFDVQTLLFYGSVWVFRACSSSASTRLPGLLLHPRKHGGGWNGECKLPPGGGNEPDLSGFITLTRIKQLWWMDERMNRHIGCFLKMAPRKQHPLERRIHFTLHLLFCTFSITAYIKSVSPHVLSDSGILWGSYCSVLIRGHGLRVGSVGNLGLMTPAVKACRNGFCYGH